MANLNDFFKSQVEPKESNKDDVILFIDYMNLVNRCIHIAHSKGQQDMMTTEEIYHYWKYMVTNNLLNSVNEYKPRRVVIALDGKNNWRKEIYPEYKANRKKIRTESIVDWEQFSPVLNEFTEELKSVFTNVYFVNVDFTEADDIIAVIAKQSLNFNKSIIITTDKDYHQLLSIKNIKIFNPIKKQFVKTLDANTDKLIKILQGDKSDNIPAVKPRIGPAKASAILKEGLEDFLNSDIEIMENYKRNTILVDWDHIPQSYVTKIKHTYENYVLKPLNSTRLLTFFAKLKNDNLVKNYNKYSSILNKVA